MAANRRRVDTLKALIAGRVATPIESTRIQDEFEEVYASGRVRKKPRRYLLQVLHSTRALDSGLKVLLIEDGVPAKDNSIQALGGILFCLERRGLRGMTLNPSLRKRFKALIVDPRNAYMHRAGAFPVSKEVGDLVDEMDACLSVVVAM